jgi:SAM-dependent methyltransferase
MMPVMTDALFSGSVAEGYRAHLEPVIFEPWADELVRFAEVAPGEVVLDVAAGTGAVTRAASRATGPQGRVVASDVSEDMLAQAIRGDEPSVVETVVSSATELDLAAGTVDVVLCQQGLQFIADRAAAVSEMRRVLRPGGRAAAAVWLAGTPLHPFELYGDVIRAAGFDLTLPGGFDMSRLVMSADEVGELLAEGGFGDIEVETRELAFRWDTAATGARAVAGTPFQGLLATLPPDRLAAVLADLEQAVAAATGPDGDFTMSSVLGRGVA